MGNLLSFLTGLSGGSAEAVDQERKQAAAEQEAELSYRRTNLEHMVKAAEEGRVNPEMVGRVYEEYMNSMQGLSGRPMAKGRAGFSGKKDLGSNSIFRDLASGAVGMFGPQPGALNIDWGAAQPKTAPTNKLGTVGDGTVPDIPQFQTTPGTPLSQLINEGGARSMPPAGGNWMYKHPETIERENEISSLQKLLGAETIRSLTNIDESNALYGPGGSQQNRWTGRASGTTHTNIGPRFNEESGQWEYWGFNKGTQKFEQIPGGEGMIPASAMQNATNDVGAITPTIKGRPAPAGTGRSTAPRVPLAVKDAKEDEKEIIAQARTIYNNVEDRFKILTKDQAFLKPDKIAAFYQQAFDAVVTPAQRQVIPSYNKLKELAAPKLVSTPSPGSVSQTEVTDDMVKALAAALAAQKK